MLKVLFTDQEAYLPPNINYAFFRTRKITLDGAVYLHQKKMEISLYFVTRFFWGENSFLRVAQSRVLVLFAKIFASLWIVFAINHSNHDRRSSLL